jgi:carboxyl-terminal processing protease
MSKRIPLFAAFACGVLAALLVGTPFAQNAPDRDESRRTELYEPLVYVIRQIDQNYVEEVDYEKLAEGAYEGMLSKLDRYSEYIPPKRFKEFQVDTKGEFGGLGIRIRFLPVERILVVESPIPGTPAAKAGILPGDRILKIIDENAKVRETKVEDLEDVFEAVERLRGVPGTKVTISVLHEGSLRPVDVTLTRAIIKIPGVRAERIINERHKIGYVYVPYFHENTVADLDKAIEKLKKEGMRALILDLRFDPGGLLTTSVDLADRFLAKGNIVSTRGRRYQDSFDAKEGNEYPDVPVVVLVNRFSASASEIVAGALKDNRRALLVGETTFGKGSVQTLIRLPEEDGALKLTTAHYYTPNGLNIDKQGIEPDVKIELPDEETRQLVVHLSEETDFVPKPKESETTPAEPDAPKTEPFRDRQLESAVDVLKGILVYQQLGDQPAD